MCSIQLACLLAGLKGRSFTTSADSGSPYIDAWHCPPSFARSHGYRAETWRQGYRRLTRGCCSFRRCFCGHGMKNPNRPMHHAFFPEAEATWRNAILNNDTRMMAQWDIDPALEPEFGWLQREHNAKQGQVLSWCNARPGSGVRSFGCRWPEHHGGGHCSPLRHSVCVNQCSGRGLCSRGMCTCDPGWSGIDCSLQAPERLPHAPPAGEDGGDAGKLTFEGNRLRPRIFVYEVPEVFNVRVLQFRRQDRCTAREFTESGHPRFSDWQYSLDYMLHEWLLHRRVTQSV